MLKALDQLISNIEVADEVSVDLIPVELVDVFEKSYAPKLGSVMIGFRQRSYEFNFGVVETTSYKEAFNLVKDSELQEEKIIYSLMFLGLFNKAASDGVKRFISLLLSKEGSDC